MLEVGMVRKKNTRNILLKNLLDCCIGALIWWLCGYAIAFGSGKHRNEFAGGENGYFFASKTNPAADDTIGDEMPGQNYFQSWFFQYAFSATAVSITSGAVAERCHMSAYVIYSIILVGFVYPVVVHWCWSTDGWLSNFALGDTSDDYNPARRWSSVGVIDFAGSGVVHLTGGVSAFCGAYIIGPRTRSKENPSSNEDPKFPSQSSSLQILGTFILWFGWYAFNAGSTLGMWPGGDASPTPDPVAGGGAPLLASRAVMTTTLSAASATITSAVMPVGLLSCLKRLATCMEARMKNKDMRNPNLDFWIQKVLAQDNRWDLGCSLNGTLGGLVSITAGCVVVEPWAAVIIGMIGSVLQISWSAFMKYLKIDDVVDAVSVHGACGMWGVLAAALFAKKDYVCQYAGGLCNGDARNAMGAFYGGNGKFLGMALLQILCIWFWVGLSMATVFKTLKIFKMDRVSDRKQRHGLDDSFHGGMDRDDEIEISGNNHDRDENPLVIP